ncbi:MAG TPA: serine/threonine-protein kinase, partial [Coleofasciculaceae cyanobacterium]
MVWYFGVGDDCTEDFIHMIGQLLAERYLILETLGSGGFSETYLARDKYLPCHPLCVVKRFQLSPNSTISLEMAHQLFETEARVLDQLGQNHAQIPTLFAYCHEQDWLYQIQEYIEGENLGERIAQGQCLTSEAAINLLKQVLPVLDHIHAHQVIHRDIKPNHFIQRNGVIVLIDFGASCCLSESGQPTEAAVSIGTPGYMPEEQEAGLAEYSSDLYALGASVIHLLTGVHPRDLQRNPITGELDWRSHLQGRVIHSGLITVLDRMVQRHPRMRYRDASEALAALKSPASIKRHALKRSGWVPTRQLWKPALLSLLLGGWYFYFSNQIEGAGAMLSQLEQVVSQSDSDVALVHEASFTSNVDRMLVAPDNRFLVTAESDHLLHLWSMPNGVMLKTLDGHTDTVTALDISQESRWLVSGGKDRTLRLWDTVSGTMRWSVEAHRGAITAVAISPDAQSIVSSSEDGTLKVWNLQTGVLMHTLTPPNPTLIPVTAVTYGGKSDRVVSANSNNQLQIWDLRTGQLHRTFAGHNAPIFSLRMADEHTLFSFGEDRTLVWNLEQEGLMRAFPQNSSQLVATLLGKQ